MKAKFKSVMFVIAIFILGAGFMTINQKKPWPVPDNYKKMKNAVPSNPESIASGKALYTTHCKSCHGTKGLGDGPKAAQLKTDAGDFSTAEFHSQSDGSIFYKTLQGRDDMPGFKKKIPDQDELWDIVNFVRTLKK